MVVQVGSLTLFQKGARGGTDKTDRIDPVGSVCRVVRSPNPTDPVQTDQVGRTPVAIIRIAITTSCANQPITQTPTARPALW